MSNKLTGVVKAIKPTIQVTEKFRKREFVVTDSAGMYPQHIQFQVVNDKCDLLDNVSEGQTVEVHYNILGREWTSPQGEIKYFNTLDAWRIEYVGSAPIPQAEQVQQPTATEEEDSDLPF